MTTEQTDQNKCQNSLTVENPELYCRLFNDAELIACMQAEVMST